MPSWHESTSRSNRPFEVVDLWRCLCFNSTDGTLLNSVVINNSEVYGSRANDGTASEVIALTRSIPTRFCGCSKTFIRWPSDAQVSNIFTYQPDYLTIDSYLLIQREPRMTSFASSFSTIKSHRSVRLLNCGGFLLHVPILK